jgi:hypothetical protein
MTTKVISKDKKEFISIMQSLISYIEKDEINLVHSDFEIDRDVEVFKIDQDLLLQKKVTRSETKMFIQLRLTE